MEDRIESSGESRTENNAIVTLPPAAAAVALRPCRITFTGLAASEAPKIEVRAWLDRLGALTAPMTGGNVVIEAVDDNRKQLRYRVQMELTMPAGVVTVALDHPSNAVHDDIYVAIRNAFRAARRQLESYAQEHPAPAGTA
jgi:ribosome-associated translation inhibitor RaiA